MSLLTELRKYKASDEFTSIVEKYNKKAEELKKAVLSTFDRWECTGKEKWTYSEHDKLNVIRNFFKDLLAEIKDDGEWAKALASNLSLNLESIEYNLVHQITNNYGLLLSEGKYNELDILRTRINEYTKIEWRINTLIEQEEKPSEEENDDIYDLVENVKKEEE